MYITGTCSSYSDILTAILANCKGSSYSQYLGTGTTIYSGNLTNSPLFPGGCKLTYIIGGDTYTIYDNALGSFEGDYITAGTINYTTRAYSLTFSVATAAVNIIYGTGTSGNNWIEELNQTAKNNYGVDLVNGTREIILRNAGESGQEDIYVCLREFSNASASFTGIQTLVRTYYNNGDAWFKELSRGDYDNTNDKYKKIPHVNLLNSNMTYWLFSNQNRIILVIKVAGNIYECFYIGCGYRVSSPVLYEHPYVALGSAYDTITYSSTNSAHSFIISNDNLYNIIIKPLGYEQTAYNTIVCPYDTYTALGTPTKCSNNDIILHPIYLVDNAAPYLSFLQLDGVYHIACEGIQSEDIITISGIDYLIFQNIYRVSSYEYMAIRKD